MFREAYSVHSPDGPEHWPVVFAKFAEMIQREPTISIGELAGIQAPTLVIAGDDDMVTLEHTIDLYRALPNAQLAIIPGASHAVMMEKPDLLNELVLDFLEHDPAPTMLPFRRAGEAAH
jgi:pimeloyl-ACP methyl ester carboxylesterase